MTYFDLKEEGLIGERQMLVYGAFKNHGDHTDLELVKLIGFTDANRVRPRRNELVKMGLIANKGKRPCHVSGRVAKVWGVR